MKELRIVCCVCVCVSTVHCVYDDQARRCKNSYFVVVFFHFLYFVRKSIITFHWVAPSVSRSLARSPNQAIMHDVCT